MSSLGTVKAIAVLYSNKGGMSDVGKFVIDHALKRKYSTDKSLRIVAVCVRNNADLGVPHVDVTNEVDRQAALAALQSKEISTVHVNVDSASAQQDMERAVGECDAVIAAFGNRQPGMPNFLCAGARLTVAAMQTCGVPRLVMLSSMGIGEDFMPFRGIRVLWAFLLRTLLRPTHRDLLGMEAAVVAGEASLDYALVRAAGLTPEAPTVGFWKVLSAPHNGPEALNISVAKADVAQFMLEEAMTPTVRRSAVTITGPPPASGDSK